GQFLSAFTPDNCLTFPFTSSRRKKAHLPVNLLFNKYIVLRKAHPSDEAYLVNASTPGKSGKSGKPSVTELFKEGKPIWLGLPIYSPSQARAFHDIIRGNRKMARRKGTFWFRLLPSQKIVACIRRVAEVRDLRLNVPRGPTQKIVADIVFSATDESAFEHTGKFLRAWDARFGRPSFPAHDILGVDFNRIGAHMIAMANPSEEHDLCSLVHRFEQAWKKLEAYRTKEVPFIQARLSKGVDDKGIPLTEKKRNV
ncbi:MAG: hypothetical protein ACTSXH_02400, partial [Promethearchaeota archaeon]